MGISPPNEKNYIKSKGNNNQTNISRPNGLQQRDSLGRSVYASNNKSTAKPQFGPNSRFVSHYKKNDDWEYEYIYKYGDKNKQQMNKSRNRMVPMVSYPRKGFAGMAYQMPNAGIKVFRKGDEDAPRILRADPRRDRFYKAYIDNFTQYNADPEYRKYLGLLKRNPSSEINNAIMGIQKKNWAIEKNLLNACKTSNGTIITEDGLPDKGKTNSLLDTRKEFHFPARAFDDIPFKKKFIPEEMDSLDKCKPDRTLNECIGFSKHENTYAALPKLNFPVPSKNPSISEAPYSDIYIMPRVIRDKEYEQLEGERRLNPLSLRFRNRADPLRDAKKKIVDEYMSNICNNTVPQVRSYSVI